LWGRGGMAPLDCPTDQDSSAQGLPWVSLLALKLTRNMVELRMTAPRECRVSRVQSSVSCGNWGEFIAHLASVGVQAVEASCLVSLFQGSEDTDIKGDPMSEQVPDDSG
jgi:hypothetical protein